MPKKVLLLHCPAKKVYLHDYYTSYSSKANYYWQPADLVLLSGVLSRFDLFVIDAIADRLSDNSCLERIKEIQPDFIIFTTGTATWENDHRFLKQVRKVSSALILGSGSIFLFEAEYFLQKMPEVDGALLDIVSPEIADFIEGKIKKPQTILLKDKKDLPSPLSVTRPAVFSIPVPRHELFNLQANRSPLAKQRPLAVVVSSIGCPFSCHFCVAGSILYRGRQVNNVLEELNYLKSLGVREIMFNDPTFTISKKRILALCEGMVTMGKPFSWVCNAHVATISEEIIPAMVRAGCHAVMIGVESASDETLRKSLKGINRKKIIEAFRLCKHYGLTTLGYFIVGLPGEDHRSVLATIQLAKEIDCDYASFTVLTPDIGSKLRQEAIAKGWLDRSVDAFDSTCFPVFAPGPLSPEEIWRLRKKAYRVFYLRPSYLFKRVSRLRSFREFVFLFDQARSMFMKNW